MVFLLGRRLSIDSKRKQRGDSVRDSNMSHPRVRNKDRMQAFGCGLRDDSVDLD
jgi:hypothetical protein